MVCFFSLARLSYKHAVRHHAPTPLLLASEKQAFIGRR